ncbi:hypothetical protein Esi_0052_0080 [Ectocarpus siliculosus]|uniref:Uncharacterized protein n=1 Tax=Ectocarpus siliculosus TaxID=2880 RepID=D8LP56_ECTSI|nr:hypothetical protein Esi_0052_0080 [Ectocarpus siliculosus]|eukprot:CBN80327.1 hypothetical protein Esi_0052_0080 [Ectocarpus siliculosus]
MRDHTKPRCFIESKLNLVVGSPKHLAIVIDGDGAAQIVFSGRWADGRGWHGSG